MKRKIVLILSTIKYLKLIQVFYRIYYLIVKKHYKQYTFNKAATQHLKFQTFLKNPDSLSQNSFSFLNKPVVFNDSIDWNYKKNGKLWTYNLNYFDFLLQTNISKEEGTRLISRFIDEIDKKNIVDGLEPYPISLRGINWIKFLAIHHISDDKIINSLYSQYILLSKRIEYHLLGNHILENGFSLMFAGYYFQSFTFYRRAKKLILKELKEQILKDGAHFELSPMYHRIILNRLLDCYNLIINNGIFRDPGFESFLKNKATNMFGWLNTMSYNARTQPNFNDSSDKAFASLDELVKYGSALNVDTKIRNTLSESGYRKITSDNFEMFIDAGNIGPDYQPGHAHSDTSNFEVRINGMPFITDTGTSTYEKNTVRQNERSTGAHNTVMYSNIEQSEVWGGFRVGRRAKANIIDESINAIQISHNGYEHLGIKHVRTFQWSSAHINITDLIQYKNECDIATAFFHFHPDIQPELNPDRHIIQTGLAQISFSGAINIEKYMYNFAEDFNMTNKAVCVKVCFDKQLHTEIKLNN